MMLGLTETQLLKIPYFELLFSSKFEGFSKSFTNYFNQILTTDPDKNLLAFLEVNEYLDDVTQKIITYNLGVFYFRYIKKFWIINPETVKNCYPWEILYFDTMPYYNEKYRSKLLVNPEWDKNIENYTVFFIPEPNCFKYIIIGLEMMFIDEIVPQELLPAFALSILIVYYNNKKEIQDLIQIEDPTTKII